MTLTHRALVYDSTDEFLDSTVPFLRSGLAAGHAAVVVAKEANLAALAPELADHRDDIDYYDSADFYRHPVRTLKSFLQVVEDKSPRQVCALAEPQWLGHEDWQLAEWFRYESLINVVFQHSGASSLCPYDARVVPDRVLAQVNETHPVLLENGVDRPSERFVEPEVFSHRCNGDRWSKRPPEAEYLHIDTEDLQPLRATVARHATSFGLNRVTAQNLVTAANEVAANAVRHGAPPMAVWLWTDGPDMYCEIGDGGLWRPLPLTGFVPPRSALEKGFGLWTVRLLVDLVELRGGWDGTYVRLRVRR